MASDSSTSEQIDWVAAKNSVGNFFVHPADAYIGQTILNGQVWEEKLLEKLVELSPLPQEGTIVDVGANLGSHTVWFAKNCPKCKIVAFEPQHKVFQQLCANVVANKLANVTCRNWALSNSAGTTTLSASADVDRLGNAVPVDLTKTERMNVGGIGFGIGGEQVEMRTLDSFHLPNVRLIKIDVEGFEHYVLMGALQTILANRPVIWFEDNIRRQVDPNTVLKVLGYNIVPLDEENFLAVFGQPAAKPQQE